MADALSIIGSIPKTCERQVKENADGLVSRLFLSSCRDDTFELSVGVKKNDGGVRTSIGYRTDDTKVDIAYTTSGSWIGDICIAYNTSLSQNTNDLGNDYFKDKVEEYFQRIGYKIRN